MKAVAKSNAPSSSDEGSAQVVEGRFTILVAEDDLEMRRLLVWSLRKAGYDVEECKDGTGLMKKLGLLGHSQDPGTIDLVISDIRMPGVTGLQVLENAQEMEDAPPMILISAFADRDAFEQAERLGAVSLLPKPFDIDDLLDLVRKLTPLFGARTARGDESSTDEPDLPFPLELTFRHGSGSEPVKEFARRLAGKMARFGEHILHCRLVIDLGNGNGSGRQRFRVNLIISTPGQPIIAEHEASADSSEENLYLALHSVFAAAYRQLKQKHQKRKPNPGSRHHSLREGS